MLLILPLSDNKYKIRFLKIQKQKKIEILKLKKVAHKKESTFYVFLLFITSIFAALLKKTMR